MDQLASLLVQAISAILLITRPWALRNINWFRRRYVGLLEWPSQSPDLNPIDHHWEELERNVRGLQATNPDQKFAQLEAAWKRIHVKLNYNETRGDW
uniref:Tc1-like transposase DDE domain-containing protein n=1 Tax=Caenorhabditis japonica TaxID=281687 RepID=A0A8R1EPC7_CAEJA